MAVRKRVWTTQGGERTEAWIVDYSDDPRRDVRSVGARNCEARHVAAFPRDGDVHRLQIL